MVKVLAFYLPQFHEIAENNAWWGEGFTEWVNTKKAPPLFETHYQPKEPFNDNYYNLLDKKTRLWQADLAKKYDVYGFVYYHYWFKGKKLLEKPAELMLSENEPDFPFCFSWANEPWSRAWSGEEKEVLIPQDYGDEEDWKNHFYYLLKFFLDHRYIKIDGKPIFIIYRSLSIPRCDEMLVFWNNLAVKNGLKGLYFIKTNTSYEEDFTNSNFSASIDFEPMYTLSHHLDLITKIKRRLTLELNKKFGTKKLDILDYDFIWNKILKRPISDKNRFLGAYVNWDNTARKNYNGLVINGGTPDKFHNYFLQQLKRAKSINSEFIFINAWNEWAEGAYLEPDKKHGYGYLDALKKALGEISHTTDENRLNG